MKKQVKNWLFIIAFILVCFIVLFPYLLQIEEYVVGYDIKNLYVPFYSKMRDMFEAGQFPFWSHENFLGTNIWVSKGPQYLFDIFSYLIVLFKNLEVLDVLLITQVIKFFVSSFLMYRLIKSFKIKREIAITGGILYAFSSWAIMFIGTPSFTSFYALLPLLFIGIEKYLKEHKIGIVILSCFLLVSIEFYLFYSVAIYLVLYWPLRYFLSYEFTKKQILSFVKDTLLLLAVCLFATLLSAPVLLPTVDFVLNVPRVSNDINLPIIWESKRTYLDLFIKFFSSPAYVNSGISSFFQNNYYRTDQIALFISSIIPILLPQVYIIGNKKQKVLFSIFVVTNLIILFTPFGCSMMHGFSEPSFRWTMLPILCIIIVLAFILQNIKKVNIKLLTVSLFLYFALLIVILFFVGNPLDYKLQCILILCSVVLSVLYATLILRSKSSTFYLYVLLIFALIEVSILGRIALSFYPKEYQTAYSYKDTIPTDYFKNFKDKNEFYRIYFPSYIVDMDYNQQFCYNFNLVYDFKGLYGYESMGQHTITEALTWNEEYFWWYKIVNPEFQNILSTKYYVAYSEQDLPNNNFTFIENIPNTQLKLYFNQNYLPFGFTTSSVLSKDEFYNYITQEQKAEVYKNYLIYSNEDIERYQLNTLSQTSSQEYLKDLQYTNIHLTANIELTEKQLLFLSIPYDKGWTITDNGYPANIILANGGFMSILLDKGKHAIEMNFIPYGFKFGCLLTIFSGFSLIGIYLFIKTKRNKNESFIKNNTKDKESSLPTL